MKNLFVFALIALLLGATTASTAKADREGRALVGGIIGGLIIGSILNHDDRHHHGHVSVSRHGHHGSGHHDTISVRTWINGSWSVYYDSHGNRHRNWHPGHFDYIQERVGGSHNRSRNLYRSPKHGNSHHGNRGRNYRRH